MIFKNHMNKICNPNGIQEFQNIYITKIISKEVMHYFLENMELVSSTVKPRHIATLFTTVGCGISREAIHHNST
jgi:predicted SprT family Zn-dependent metalloprotease